MEPAWYEWNSERGPLTNQDYQREIEDKSMVALNAKLVEKRMGKPCKIKVQDQLSYQLGGSFNKLEQVTFPLPHTVYQHVPQLGFEATYMKRASSLVGVMLICISQLILIDF